MLIETSRPAAAKSIGRSVLLAVAALLLAGWAALFVTFWTAHGHSWFFGPDGRPVAYDWQRFGAAASAFVGSASPPALGWLNPPNFLLIVAPLALLPYATAAFVWIAVTGAGYVAAARMALGRGGAAIFALAAPAAVSCVIKGQSGFLSAALIGFGLMLLDRRPAVAGFCIGMLAYKPHLGLVLPLLLAIGGYWRSMAVAAATVAGLVIASAVIFGPSAWLAFLGSIGGTAEHFLVQGSSRAAMQSAYSLATPLFGPVGAGLVHAAVVIAALCAAVLPWRMGTIAPEPHAAAGIAVAFLAPPYVFQHDAAMLTIAALLLARDRPGPHPTAGEAAWLCLAILLPAFTLFVATNLPGPAAAIILLAIARRQSKRAAMTSSGGAPAPLPCLFRPALHSPPARTRPESLP